MNLITGSYNLSVQEVSVGQPGSGGLTYARSFIGSGWRDNYVGTIEANTTTSTYTVSFGGASESFVLAGGVYTPAEGQGSTLTYNSGPQTYTYTGANGMVAVFAKAYGGFGGLNSNDARITSLTLPSGETVTFTYKSVTVCQILQGNCSQIMVTRHRLQSVTNNLGYHLKFEYSANSASTSADIEAWTTVTKVTGVNGAVNYCNPTADSCTGLTQTWPNATYAFAGGTTWTVTDTLSQVTRYIYDGSGRITGIRRPSSPSTNNVTLTYDGSSRVATVSNGTGTWTYGYSDAGSVRTTTVTDPLSHARVVVSNLTTGLITSDKDALNRTTSYLYDGQGRVTRITAPEGNYTEFTYDARGNAAQTTQVAKSGSGLSDIVTSAAYDTTCSNPVTCNKPNSTTDAQGATTDYTYHATHGDPLTVTAPEPTSGAVRPQTRMAYTALYAYYKNSGGTIVAAATPVYRLTATSACATTAATGSPCAGGSSDEVKTTITYGSTGVANNLLPTSTSSGDGGGTLTATTAMTYDNVGNLLTVDGPLSGTADTTRYRYDNGRRLVGVAGPDPDGGSALKHRAVRTTYNVDGQPTLVERGTVNSQSDGDWTAFAMLEQQTLAYDTVGRKVKETLVASSATQAVVQYSYDNANRLDCTAWRMNPAVFGSPPGSACTLGTTGSNGPDRISRNNYNNADQVTSVTVAYATGVARTEASATYTSNGLQATLADAKGNLTTYEYDGFDRPKKVRYPDATTGTTSSTTDYEQYAYDTGSNVTQVRQRDAQTINYAYDALNRQTVGLDGAAYTYDNLGRMASVSLSGDSLTWLYDALGRLVSETGALGAVVYQYDLAGRRTRLTWPDSYYVTYDHDVTGAMTAVRENGAASGVGVLATYAYDNLGRRTGITRGNGVTTAYAYDAASRLSTLTQNLAGTSGDQTLTFGYNAAGQAISRAGTNTAYDPASPATVTRSYTPNGLNQLTTAGSATLTHDGRGNLTSDGTKTYGYDVANRLTSATGGVTLAYDLAGRLAQTVGTSTNRFMYDGGDMIGEYNAGGTLLRRYVHGPASDEPLVWYEGSGTTDRRWLVADQLGSIIAVTNSSGTPTATNKYDEYGIPGGSNTGRFQYTGQTWVPEVGLYHYKARVYSPVLGRFLQTDPIGYGDGMNIYAYVGNDPVNRTDPSGLSFIDENMPTCVAAKACGGGEDDGVTVIAPCALGIPCIYGNKMMRELDQAREDEIGALIVTAALNRHPPRTASSELKYLISNEEITYQCEFIFTGSGAYGFPRMKEGTALEYYMADASAGGVVAGGISQGFYAYTAFNGHRYHGSFTTKSYGFGIGAGISGSGGVSRSLNGFFGIGAAISVHFGLVSGSVDTSLGGGSLGVGPGQGGFPLMMSITTPKGYPSPALGAPSVNC